MPAQTPPEPTYTDEDAEAFAGFLVAANGGHDLPADDAALRQLWADNLPDFVCTENVVNAVRSAAERLFGTEG